MRISPFDIPLLLTCQNIARVAKTAIAGTERAMTTPHGPSAGT
jgi:hypothetical protein